MAPSPIQQRSCGPQCHGVSLEMSTTKHLLAGEGGKLSMADSAWELGVSSDPCQGARAGISKINTKFKIEKKERTGWQCPQVVCVCVWGGVLQTHPKAPLGTGRWQPQQVKGINGPRAPSGHQPQAALCLVTELLPTKTLALSHICDLGAIFRHMVTCQGHKLTELQRCLCFVTRACICS